MAERQYFELAKGNINKIWQTINIIIARPSHNNGKHIKEIKVDDKIVMDNQVIANKFNNYFSNIDPTLAKKITPVTENISEYLKGNFSNGMFLADTNLQEITAIVKLLQSSSNRGIDICSKIIKEVKLEIAEPLSSIFN